MRFRVSRTDVGTSCGASCVHVVGWCIWSACRRAVHVRLKKRWIVPLVLFAVIMILWVLAWVLKTDFLDHIAFFASSLGSFLYWTLSKIVIWLLPFMLYFRLKPIKIADNSIKSKDMEWLKWGVIIGSIIALINIILNLVSNQSIWNPESGYAFLNAVIMAPLLEELLFRGYMLKLLREEMPFYIANLITSACFVMMHVPGWFFMGVLRDNFYNFSFVMIFVLSLIFGYAYKKGSSIKASFIAHVLNNVT